MNSLLDGWKLFFLELQNNAWLKISESSQIIIYKNKWIGFFDTNKSN